MGLGAASNTIQTGANKLVKGEIPSGKELEIAALSGAASGLIVGPMKSPFNSDIPFSNMGKGLRDAYTIANVTKANMFRNILGSFSSSFAGLQECKCNE